MRVEPMERKTHAERPNVDPEFDRKSQMAEQNKMEKTIEKAENVAASQNDHIAQELMTVQPQKQVEQTAKEQLEKGYIDVRV